MNHENRRSAVLVVTAMVAAGTISGAAAGALVAANKWGSPQPGQAYHLEIPSGSISGVIPKCGNGQSAVDLINPSVGIYGWMVDRNNYTWLVCR